jgi:hypothetical protein
MIFSKKRNTLNNTSQDSDYKILRFCNKLNTQIIDSASILLNYFIEKYKPKSIITFVDRRYSQRELYNELGFNHINNTKPNYWYYNKHNYNLKYQFKFKRDVNLNKTKSQIMVEMGYYKIYDCGNMKFELTF